MTPWFGITCKHPSASIGRPQTTDSTPCGVSKYSIGPIFSPSVRKKALVTKVKKTKSDLETVSDSNHAFKDLWSLLNEDSGVGVGQPIVFLKATAQRMRKEAAPSQGLD